MKNKITLNYDQEVFVNEAAQRLATNGWWTLCGNAGTGKTTCLAQLMALYGNIVFLAPTHKAKSVLQEKLGEEAYVITTTSFTKGFKGTKLERLEFKISDAERSGDADLIKKLQRELKKLIKSGTAQEPVFGVRDRSEEDEGKWISVVCDEASMVDIETRDQIIENSDSAIFVGDDFQVPPVVKNPRDQDHQDWFRRANHDWRLHEVVRQAQGSGVLRLATLVREAGADFDFPIRRWMQENEDEWDDLFLLDEGFECYDQALEDDTMMLSFMNDVVDEFSYDVRKSHGRCPKTVTPEDKLFASNNFGEDWKNKDEIQCVENMSIKPAILTATLNNLTTGMKGQCLINTARLKVGIKASSRREMLSSKGLVLRYDYARTIHSSQGSEWCYVMYRHCGVDRLDTLTHNRLLYTAITRASENFILLS